MQHVFGKHDIGFHVIQVLWWVIYGRHKKLYVLIMMQLSFMLYSLAFNDYIVEIHVILCHTSMLAHFS